MEMSVRTRYVRLCRFSGSPADLGDNKGIFILTLTVNRNTIINPLLCHDLGIFLN